MSAIAFIANAYHFLAVTNAELASNATTCADISEAKPYIVFVDW